MPALANAVRGSRRFSRASISRCPRLCRITARSPALSQDEITVAMAMPTCLNGPINRRFSTRLVTSARAATLTGVAVSSRAKNPGVSALTST